MTRTQTELAQMAEAIAEAAGTAYMADDYGYDEFCKVAKYLLQQGHTAQEAEAILKSKHMRWADDSQGYGNGKSTNAAAFKRYYVGITSFPMGVTDWIAEGRALALETGTDLPDDLQGISMYDDRDEEAEDERNYEIASADEVWALTKREADMLRTAVVIAYEDHDAADGMYSAEEVEALWKRFVPKAD